MKKQLLAIAAIAFVAGAVIMTSCKKEDTTAPTITLTGGASMSQSLPSTAGSGSFTDPGFTAEDDEDGNVSANVTVTIKDAGQVTRTATEMANRKGSYVITYTVSDKAGNQGSVTRTVDIQNDAEYLVGSYSAASVDSCTTGGVGYWNMTTDIPDVFSSDTVNNLIKINNFGIFGESINIWMNVSGTNLTPTTTNQSLGGSAYIQNVYVSPATTIYSTGPVKFKIKYQWTDGTNSDVCTTHYIK